MGDYEQNIELIKKAQAGDDDAKNMLIQQNYPLVKSVIRRYRNKGVDYDDLFQLGCVGFVKAINNFDTSYKVKFSTYAVPMIIGEVKRHLRDDGYIKVSRAMKVLYLQIKKYVDTETQAGKSPSIAEIASNFGITAEDVVFAMDSGRYPVSIFSPLDNDDDGGTLVDKIPSNVDTDRELDHLVLKELISGLEPRDQKIIIMRYYRDKTQSEIAKELGVSQVQVSRLENKILSRLKNNLQVKD